MAVQLNQRTRHSQTRECGGKLRTFKLLSQILIWEVPVEFIFMSCCASWQQAEWKIDDGHWLVDLWRFFSKSFQYPSAFRKLYYDLRLCKVKVLEGTFSSSPSKGGWPWNGQWSITKKWFLQHGTCTWRLRQEIQKRRGLFSMMFLLEAKSHPPKVSVPDLSIRGVGRNPEAQHIANGEEKGKLTELGYRQHAWEPNNRLKHIIILHHDTDHPILAILWLSPWQSTMVQTWSYRDLVL